MCAIDMHTAMFRTPIFPIHGNGKTCWGWGSEGWLIQVGCLQMIAQCVQVFTNDCPLCAKPSNCSFLLPRVIVLRLRAPLVLKA